MQIEITKSAKKSMKKMDAATRNRIIAGIQKIPSGDIRKLQGYENDYRLRIGDYRILYTITGDLITVNDVLPRGEAYKRL